MQDFMNFLLVQRNKKKLNKQTELNFTRYSAKLAQLNGNAEMHQMHKRYVNLIHDTGHGTIFFS